MSSEEPVRDNFLWHYTSWSAADSILANGTLRASHVGYLNDLEELKPFREALISQLESFRGEASNQDAYDGLRNSLTKQIREWSEPFYVICFSRREDHLSQWRGYGGQGIAVALAFDRPLLVERFEKEKPKDAECFVWRKCVYDDRELVEAAGSVIREVLQPVGERIEKRNTPNEQFYFRHDWYALVAALRKHMPVYKSSEFSDEKEERFVCQLSSYDKRQLGFHVAGRLLVPHVDVEVIESRVVTEEHRGPYIDCPLKEIMIGPGPHLEENMNAIRIALQSRGYQSVVVSKTKVPFRSG